MSDTPKTDMLLSNQHFDCVPYDDACGQLAEFARDLERRLNRANALLAEMKSAIKFAKSEAKERLQRLDSAASERRQWLESEHRAKVAERESFAQWCQAVGHLSTIAEDCEAWLNSESDEPSVDFIKAIRDYAKKACT
jgi:uncharacterized membrane protein YccC